MLKRPEHLTLLTTALSMLHVTLWCLGSHARWRQARSQTHQLWEVETRRIWSWSNRNCPGECSITQRWMIMKRLVCWSFTHGRNQDRSAELRCGGSGPENFKIDKYIFKFHGWDPHCGTVFLLLYGDQICHCVHLSNNCSTCGVLKNRRNTKCLPALLWSFCESGAGYKTAHLGPTYLP